MVLSEITIVDVAEYLRLDDATDPLLPGILNAAKQYIVSYTGQTAAALDDFSDVPIAVMVLCQDMYDNRSMYVDKNNVNRVVDTILGMYRINLLPVEGDE